MQTEREFLAKVEEELEFLRGHVDTLAEVVSTLINGGATLMPDTYRGLERLECMCESRRRVIWRDTTPAAPADESSEGTAYYGQYAERAAAEGWGVCVEPRKDEDFEECAPTPEALRLIAGGDPWEGVEDELREAISGLRGYFEGLVDCVLHVVRLERVGGDGIIKDRVILKLLRRVANEDRLPDGHAIREWARAKLPHYE